jgi:hypothetical protein
MSNPLYFKLRLEALEDRRLLSASGSSTAPNLAPPQTTYENLIVSNVVGENIFYNDSSYDGNSLAANAADDAAIATDKTALLPGQTATFANYTSYTQGINGIMVDIAGLPSNLTASDFVFTVGNSNDPTTWTPLTVAPTVTTRWGAGVQGSARVELTWPNNTIDNEWLQVTVLADADTGLSANTVFYFGNAIGDTGNSTTDAQVNSADLVGMPTNQHVGVTNVYDFARTGYVNSSDATIVLSNQTTAATALNLITTPAAATQAPFAAEQPDFMEAWGDYYYFFTAQIVETNDGTLVSVAEARTGQVDSSVVGLAETTSTDGGQTWSPVTIIASIPNNSSQYLGMGSMVVDQTTNQVFLVYTIDNNQVLEMSTANDGQTWSTPSNITSSVMLPSWGYFAAGPSNGIQLTIGPDTGRLVIAFDYRYANDTTNPADPSYDAVIYSDNNGATWQLGGGPSASDSQNSGVNEAAIVQLSDGAIYMNSRLKFADNTAPARGYSVSNDGGITWSNVQYTYQLPVSSVEGSLVRLDPNTILFSAPTDPDDSGVRQQMTIWASFDNGQTWTKERTINYDFASYSDMVALGNDTALLVFNAGQEPGSDSSYQKEELVKFNLAALESPQPDQFTWTFNEQPIGQAAPIGGSSIRDDGVLDERATVESSGGAPYYVAGVNGGEALRIVNGSNVALSPATTDGLQFGTGQSFTFQFTLRTTSANGVLVGEMPGDPGYTFSLVNGAITLNVDDGTHSVTLTGSTIDDGAWHSVVGVRNAATKTLSLYVDGTLVATAADDTGSLQNADAVTLGSYSDGSSQLTLDIGLLQVTRAALAPSQFLPSSYVAPQTLPAPTTAANNVLDLPGLSFYLPPYDDRNYFADLNESDPLLIQPTPGTAARSAIDATGQYDVASPSGAPVFYESNATVGNYWSSQTWTGWTVANSNGTQSPNQNFDFVQNSETFTISDVFNVPAVPTSGGLELVGNNSNTSALPGFDLSVGTGGDLDFNITDGTGTGASLIDQKLATFAAGNSSVPQLSTGSWYQIVIVGNGAGSALQYYLTSMTATAVAQYQTSATMTPIAAPTATAATQNLQIANVLNCQTGTATPTLNFKDLAIFNQALTPAEVQQLFLDEVTPPAVKASGAINTFTIGGAATAVDSSVTVSTGDADLTGATVTISPTTLQPGDTLNFASQNGISGVYSNGTLTLSGSATPAQYQAALQSITFSTTSTDTATRSISIVADEGPLAGTPVAEQLNVTTALPVLAASGTTNTFTVGGAAVAVDSWLASPSSTELTGVTMTISPGTLQPGDTLGFVNQNGISDRYAGGVLTLSGNATATAYATALQSVIFSTTSINVVPRAISIVPSDGALEGVTASEQVNIAIAPPVLTASGAIDVYTVGGAPAAIDSGVIVSSYDADLTGATVTISAATLQPGDRLNFANQNGISGSYSAGTLTLSGSATPAQYQAALRSVTFSTTSTITLTRAMSIVALDNGLTSNTAAESLDSGANFVTLAGPAAGYTVGGSAVNVAARVTVSSADGDLTGATVTISAGTLQPADSLNFVSPAGSGITGIYSGGVLTLSGSATVAQYQAALQSVAFSTTNVGTAPRSISIVTLDGALTSNTVSEQISVSAPITIVGAYVAGSSWSSTGTTANFDAYLARHALGNVADPALGYALQTGGAQLNPLPWVNINTISVQFSGPVSNIGLGSLALVGGTGGGAVAPPAVTGFTNDGNNIYSWTLAGPLGNNKYVFAVATAGSSFGTPGSTQVTDANGAGISGAFTTSSSAFPSGNGLAGSTFNFFFNVLPGDGNQAAIVNSTDAAEAKALNNSREITASYNPYLDFNGAGLINSTDPLMATANNNARQSGITAPLAPSATRLVGGTTHASLAALTLAVLESTSAPAASTVQAIAVAGVSPASSVSVASTTVTNSAATSPSNDVDPSATTASTNLRRSQHGRHSFAATDAAVADFSLADLYL